MGDICQIRVLLKAITRLTVGPLLQKNLTAEGHGEVR